MSYTSYFYLLFFLGALVILYYLMPHERRWLVLLGGSYFFYWLASGKLIGFPTDHDGVGLSGGSCYGAGAESL